MTTLPSGYKIEANGLVYTVDHEIGFDPAFYGSKTYAMKGPRGGRALLYVNGNAYALTKDGKGGRLLIGFGSLEENFSCLGQDTK